MTYAGTYELEIAEANLEISFNSENKEADTFEINLGSSERK